MNDTVELDPRYELNELVPLETLTGLVRPFVQTVKLATGIVRNPRPEEEMPTDPSEFGEWRYTPVLGIDRAGAVIEGGSEFCQTIRKLEPGNQLCMRADLARAHTAYSKKEAFAYNCDPAGLRDIVAPITVGGHHLANVYLGQCCDTTSTFETALQRYHKLVEKSSDADEEVDDDTLRALYEQLWHSDEVPDECVIKALLGRLAELISQRAAREAALRTISAICRSVGPAFDHSAQAGDVLAKLGRSLRFTSGSIMLVEDNWLTPVACVYPPKLQQRMRIALESNDGIASAVLQDRTVRRFSTRREIEEYRRPAVAGSRDQRELVSLLVAPLLVDGTILGILEVGEKEEHVYSEDDEKLIKALADYLAMRLKSNEDYKTLTCIVQHAQHDELVTAVANEIPKLVHGEGCSVFLRDLSSWRVMLPDIGSTGRKPVRNFRKQAAHLVATSEFPVRFPLTYEPGEGLTGWVLETGKVLCIEQGKDARELAAKRLSPRGEWCGKRFNDVDGSRGREYYKDRPFLAVPITASNGIALGVIRISDSSGDNFTDADQRTLEACATAVAAKIEATSAVTALQTIDEEFGKIQDILKTQTASLQRVTSETPSTIDLACSRAAGFLAIALILLSLTLTTTPVGSSVVVWASVMAALAGFLWYRWGKFI